MNIRNLIIISCLSFVHLALLSHQTIAQAAARETQSNVDAGILAERSRGVADELRPGESSLEQAPWSPRTEDIGEQLILKEMEKYQIFTAFADASYYTTDNVALTSRGELDDQYFVGQIGLSAQPKLGKSLFGEVTIRQQFFRYNEFDSLDFDGLDAGAGLTYITEKLTGVAFFTRYNYKRLTDAEENNEFFTSHTWKFGVQKPFILSRAHFFYVALSSEFALATEPEFSRRNQYSFDAGYYVNLTRSISAQLYYRGSYYDYYESDRGDWNHIAGISAEYNVTDWLSVNIFGTYSFNRSNIPVFDYDAGNAGGGLALRLKF